MPVADPDVDVPEDAGDIAVVELAERLGVAALGEFDEGADPGRIVRRFGVDRDPRTGCR